MIEIKGVSKSFKNHTVLNDINLTIEDKQILGLIGINGAGKSTLLRILAGVYRPDSGSVLYDGKDILSSDEIRSTLFFLPDSPYYSGRTTPANLLGLMKAFYKVNEVTYYEALDYFKIPIHTKMDKFSKGMKRQVFICLAFAIRPKYLLLDEAFDGLDPLARLKFKKEIRALVDECGTTVIISSHSLKELEDMCDCFAMLDKNKIACQGAVSDALGTLHKYQMAFTSELDLHFFPRIFKSIQQDSRVVRIVSQLSMEEITRQLESFHPIFIEELPIEFDEVFRAIVEDGGYLR